jgi:hypothetical protein
MKSGAMVLLIQQECYQVGKIKKENILVIISHHYITGLCSIVSITCVSYCPGFLLVLLMTG